MHIAAPEVSDLLFLPVMAYRPNIQEIEVKHRVFRCYQKLAKLDHTGEADNAYNADCYDNKDLYNREKEKEIEYEENDLVEFVQEVLSHCDTIFQKITKRRKETPGMNEETKNKVNKVYQKNEVMPEESLCENSGEKVLIVEERFLDDESSIAKELGKDRRNMKKKARSNLKAQGNLNSVADFERIKKDKKGTCFDSLENDKFNNRKFWEFDQKRKKKIETISLGPKEIMNGKTQRNKNYRILTGDEKRSVKEWCNSMMGKWMGKRRNEETYQDKTYKKNIGNENGFEKAHIDQDILLKVEVKDAEALVCQGFRSKKLVSENQRIYQPDKPEDQFQETIVQNMDIRNDGIILVSKIVHTEEKDKKSSDLHESYRKAFQNAK
ncbi:8209_t:CDS:10 [Gigaspora margarita]|uniref:8209_t:CDS:1 n=1 Tax=Gigaspora margarita TaxID=4874 RepID=A0ABM8VXQ1_GIGMA|nr:8209_t:CDS:10 [Gigaspora margarita]